MPFQKKKPFFKYYVVPLFLKNSLYVKLGFAPVFCVSNFLFVYCSIKKRNGSAISAKGFHLKTPLKKTLSLIIFLKGKNIVLGYTEEIKKDFFEGAFVSLTPVIPLKCPFSCMFFMFRNA
ncbi:MAG: hypothetical protein CM15mV136_170 [Caudoviricetes sp.]|nr:MAG: hypothetical protein CM15mV136_170 [Caudoviricetes sp.]